MLWALSVWPINKPATKSYHLTPSQRTLIDAVLEHRVLIPSRPKVYHWTLLQFSFAHPIQVFPEYHNIIGARINLGYGKNLDLLGVDVGVVNELRTLIGIQAGLVNFSCGMIDDLHKGGVIAGLQAALIANLALGDLFGIQIGLANDARNVYGCQIGGLINHSAENLYGLQVGLINLCNAYPFFEDFRIQEPTWNILGMQIGAINRARFIFFSQTGLVMSEADTVWGLQYGTLYCRTVKTIYGLQIGAVTSVNNIHGIQLGVLNMYVGDDQDYSGLLHGIQFGLINVRKRVAGIQVGFINYAERMNGLQLGVFNIITKNYLPFFPGINIGISY